MRESRTMRPPTSCAGSNASPLLDPLRDAIIILLVPAKFLCGAVPVLAESVSRRSVNAGVTAPTWDHHSANASTTCARLGSCLPLCWPAYQHSVIVY